MSSAVGRWTIEEALGNGRLGALYLVRSDDGSRGALRALRRDLFAKPGSRGRAFGVIARLQEEPVPGTVPVEDFVVAKLDWALVSALQPGLSLADLLDPSGLAGSWTPRAETAADVLNAVGAALLRLHDVGLAHGALGPHDILVSEDGQPLIAEPGLVALAGGSLADPAVDARGWARLALHLRSAWADGRPSAWSRLDRAAELAGARGDLEGALRLLDGGRGTTAGLGAALAAWRGQPAAVQVPPVSGASAVRSASTDDVSAPAGHPPQQPGGGDPDQLVFHSAALDDEPPGLSIVPEGRAAPPALTTPALPTRPPTVSNPASGGIADAEAEGPARATEPTLPADPRAPSPVPPLTQQPAPGPPAGVSDVAARFHDIGLPTEMSPPAPEADAPRWVDWDPGPTAPTARRVQPGPEPADTAPWETVAFEEPGGEHGTDPGGSHGSVLGVDHDAFDWLTVESEPDAPRRTPNPSESVIHEVYHDPVVPTSPKPPAGAGVNAPQSPVGQPERGAPGPPPRTPSTWHRVDEGAGTAEEAAGPVGGRRLPGRRRLLPGDRATPEPRPSLEGPPAPRVVAIARSRPVSMLGGTLLVVAVLVASFFGGRILANRNASSQTGTDPSPGPSAASSLTVSGVTLKAPDTAKCGATIQVSATVTTNGGDGDLVYTWHRSDGSAVGPAQLHADGTNKQYSLPHYWTVPAGATGPQRVSLEMTSPAGVDPQTVTITATC